MAKKMLRVGFLNGGWLLVHGAAPGELYVRTVPEESGRLRIREFYLDSGEPITADVLRELPLADIEGIANLESDHVRARMAEPGGDRLRILASHLGEVLGHPGVRIEDDGSQVDKTWRERAAEDWVAGSWLASLSAEDRAAAGLGDIKPPRRAPILKPRARADFRLTAGPQGGRLDERFMRDLARAYLAAVARGESPNKTIAQDTGYPPRTVESWVYRTRKRGYLPPARKGAAG